MNKIPLILWSGGLDSTYLIYDRLRNGYNVDILNIELKNNTSIHKHEKVAIQKSNNFFENSNLPAKIRNFITYEINSVKSTIIFSQPLIWISAILFNFNHNNHSCVEISYINGDDFWHYKHDILKYFNNIVDVHFDNKIDLNFPLEWNNKHNIIKDMKKTVLGRKLLKCVRYCEDVKIKPCGVCSSCLRHKAAMIISEE